MRAGITIPDQIDFKTNIITSQRVTFYNDERINPVGRYTIKNIYVSNNKTQKYMKQK